MTGVKNTQTVSFVTAAANIPAIKQILMIKLYAFVHL
jgi:hypothetical protein